MHLYEPFVFRPAGVNVLQLVLVKQVSGIVKILGSGRALFYAGAALDADAIDPGHIRRVNGAHGAQLRAQTAAAALCHVRSGFYLQDADGVSVAIPWGVIGADWCFPPDGNRRILCPGLSR